MKKILLVLLMMILVSAFVFPLVAASAEEAISPFEYAVAFANAYPERYVFSEKEKESATVLKSFLLANSYEVKEPEFTYTYTSLNGAKITSSYQHVLGFKDNGKGKYIVIGAFYGGYDPVSETEALGQSAETALSVGVLQYIAKALTTYTAYDVVIAFWGGLSVGEFDLEKCGVDISKIALYINLDGVAAGTNDYMYCDEVSRSQDSYFRKIIEGIGANIAEPPANKKAILNTSADGAYSFTHLGLFGANAYFLEKEIPCVSFVGGAWSYSAGIYRYEGLEDVAGTKKDTFDTINERNGGQAATESRLLAVSNVILNGLNGEGLSEMLEAAQNESTGADLNSDLAYYLITFLSAAAVIIGFIILIVKQGKDRREEVWEGSFGQNEQEQPPVESPTENNPFAEFNGEDSDSKEQSNEDDDVFRF